MPPHNKRHNAAERAIQTFKNHFVAGLCSCYPDFPIHLWDRLLPHALLSLNLMRASRVNPLLSAYVQVYGPFTFNKTPIAPPGIKVLVHEKPAVRKTWALHAVEGWYIGPALDSYCFYCVWIWETAKERTTATLAWFPKYVTMPTATSTDLLFAGLRDVIHALNNPSNNSPLAPLTDSNVLQLKQLVSLLSRAADNHDTHAPQPQTSPTHSDPTEAPILPLPRVDPAPLLRVEPAFPTPTVDPVPLLRVAFEPDLLEPATTPADKYQRAKTPHKGTKRTKRKPKTARMMVTDLKDFLLGYHPRYLRIHSHSCVVAVRGNHRTLQFSASRSKRICLLWNSQRHVRTPAGWTTDQ